MYPLREDGWISLLQHLLELLVGGRSPRWKQRDFFVSSQTDAINRKCRCNQFAIELHAARDIIIYSSSKVRAIAPIVNIDTIVETLIYLHVAIIIICNVNLLSRLWCLHYNVTKQRKS